MKKSRKLKFAEALIALQARKTQLAEFDPTCKEITAGDVRKISESQDLGIEVKTRNSKGDFVIRFSSNDNWIGLEDWLHNYKCSIRERYEEALAAMKVLQPKKIRCEVFETEDETSKVVKAKARPEPTGDGEGTRIGRLGRSGPRVVDDELTEFMKQHPECNSFEEFNNLLNAIKARRVTMEQYLVLKRRISG